MANASNLQYGPEIGRGPFTSTKTQTTSLQLAMILAQMRAPKSGDDADIEAHADFIRDLADRLCPDFECQLSIQVFPEAYDTVRVIITAPTGTYSLLDIWLADIVGGGITSTPVTGVTFALGTILQTVVSLKNYRVLTTAAGVVDMTIEYTAARNWYVGIMRRGRPWYSAQVHFA